MAYTNDPAQQSNQLPLSIDFPKDEDQRIEAITSAYKRTVDSMNTKIGGLFSLEEVADFERWFKKGNPQQTRSGYRKTFEFKGNSLTFNHGIQSLKQVTNYRAIVRTSAGEWLKVPFVDVTDVAKQISMTVNETQVIITIGANFVPTIIQGIAVIEYLKQE